MIALIGLLNVGLTSARNSEYGNALSLVSAYVILPARKRVIESNQGETVRKNSIESNDE